MLTGVFDRDSVNQSPELDQERRALKASFNTVQTCRIFGEVTAQGIYPTGGNGESTVADKACTVGEYPGLSIIPITHTHYSDGTRRNGYGRSRVLRIWQPCRRVPRGERCT